MDKKKVLAIFILLTFFSQGIASTKAGHKCGCYQASPYSCQMCHKGWSGDASSCFVGGPIITTDKCTDKDLEAGECSSKVPEIECFEIACPKKSFTESKSCSVFKGCHKDRDWGQTIIGGILAIGGIIVAGATAFFTAGTATLVGVAGGGAITGTGIGMIATAGGGEWCSSAVNFNWDNSQYQCVSCKGMLEDKICADSGHFYIDCDGNCPPGAQTCEQDCSPQVSPECDELEPNKETEVCVSPKDKPVFKGKCNNCKFEVYDTCLNSTIPGGAPNCNADPECAGKKPNTNVGYGFCNDKCEFSVGCEGFNGGYKDEEEIPEAIRKTPDELKCLNYDYAKYSSANQIRQFYRADTKKCNCNVTFDSYIESVTFYGLTGDLNIFENREISATIAIKNTAERPHENWIVGAEFKLVEDYAAVTQDPNTWDATKEITAWYDGRTGSGSSNENSGCEIVSQDKFDNEVLDVDETIKVRCWAPASFFGITSGNQRVMVWAHEREQNQDAGKNGNAGNDWWSDALAWAIPNSKNNNLKFKIIPPVPIEDIKFDTGVKNNTVVTVSWKLNLTSSELAKYKVWHTNVHCFRPGTARATNRYAGEVLDPACKNIDFSKYETETCNATCEYCFAHYPDIPTPQYPSTPMKISTYQDVYTVQFLVDTLGDYACRVSLMREGFYNLSEIFKIKVIEPTGPHCKFVPDYYEAIGPFSANLTVSLVDFPAEYLMAINSVNIKCKDDEGFTAQPLTGANASKTCNYPQVEEDTVYQASAFVDFPPYPTCAAQIKVKKPPPCEITKFELKGKDSDSSTVFKNEIIVANLTGKYCNGKTATIKDSYNEVKCTCTFVNDVCENTNCFNAPSKLGSYVYYASHKDSVRSASLTVFNYGLNIIEESYENMIVNWYLLPEVPSRQDKMLLILDARDTNNNPLTPETGFAPRYRVAGTTKSFKFLPELYSNTESLWVAELSSSSTSFIVYAFDYSSRERNMSMRANITLGTITIKPGTYSKEWNHMFISITPQNVPTGKEALIKYRTRSSYDFSPFGEGFFTKTDGSYDADFDVEDSFWLEIVASAGGKAGGAILSYGLTPPNISLEVSPSNIQAAVPKNIVYETKLTLNNTGTSTIRDITITPSSTIKNVTTVSYSFNTLSVGEANDITISFNVSDKDLKGEISIKYSNLTKTVPVDLMIQDPALIKLDPSRIKANYTAGRAIRESFSVTNNAKISVKIRDMQIKELPYPNVSVDFVTQELVPNANKIFTLKGVINTAGNYYGSVEIYTDLGLKSLPVNLTIFPPICDNDGICDMSETHESCPNDCPSTAACNNDLECNGFETYTSCPHDCQPVCDNDGYCNSDMGENSENCPHDCVPSLELGRNISSLETRVTSLRERMKKLGERVTEDMEDLLDDLEYYLNDAKKYYQAGNNLQAQTKLSMAWERYEELNDKVYELEKEMVAAGFPFIWILPAVLGIAAGSFIFLFKLGYIPKFWKKEEEYF